MKQIKESMAKVRSDKTVDARTEAAECLASLTQKISSKEVTDALVTELTSSAHSPDDSVRGLGGDGPRESRACRQGSGS